MLLVGPDGTGKSTTAERLASSDVVGVVAAGHYRPGILWRRSPEATVTPHGEQRRSVVVAAIKLGAVFIDFCLGHAGPWRRVGRTGVIVVERGWWDHVADPVRYRLPPRLSGLAAIIGRLLPRADLVVILGGDPTAIVARKPELSAEEVAAQLERWRALAPRAGRRVLELDTVHADPEQTAAHIEQCLTSVRWRWMAVPATPSRNRVVATVGTAGRTALGVYRPNSRVARMAAPFSKIVVQAGAWRRVSAPDALPCSLVEVAGLTGTVGMAAMGSPGRERMVVGLAQPGRLLAVAKVGPPDDVGLRTEAAILTEVQAVGAHLRTPAVRFSGEVGDRFVLITDAVPHSGPPVDRSEIDPVLRDLEQVGEEGLVHGDLAPWNLVRTVDGDLVVLDFEHASRGSRPGFDLCHFLVQSGALLGTHSPADALDDLRRSVPETADRLGENPRPVAELVADYCRTRRTRDDAGVDELRFMAELEALATTACGTGSDENDERMGWDR